MRIPLAVQTFCLFALMGAAMQVAPYACTSIGEDSPKELGSPLNFAWWGGFTSPERARFHMDEDARDTDLCFWLYVAFNAAMIRWVHVRGVSRRVKPVQPSL